jgi:hypothetical protein
MAATQAATRIVEIQNALTAQAFLGTRKRVELMAEQTELWESFFPGRPYDAIAKDAWMHKTIFRWG